MKKYFFVIIALLQTIYCYSSNIYSANTLSADIKQNAKAVVRLDEGYFKVFSKESAEEWTHQVITILNEEGNNLADYTIFYDPLISISDLKCQVYDASGKVIRKFKKKDIKDYSAISSFSIYEDNRIKVIENHQRNYPYTVEISYKKTYKGLIGYPKWRAYPTYNVAVEKATFNFMIPEDLKFKLKTFKVDQEPIKSKNENGLDEYKWSFSNLKPIKKEEFSPKLWETTPLLWFAPNEFLYDNVEGTLENWKKFGEWLGNIQAGYDNLPDEAKTFVHQLTDNLNSDKEKAKALYHYLQKNTRYVSIQLGIGGLRPFPATNVYQNSYGDCKALSNFMRALLKEAGIKSHYTVIGNDMDYSIGFKDFCSVGQANHVILCVPSEKDTTWLECTNSKMPFGYIGKSNNNRNALIITPEGGKVVKTPRFLPEDNKQIRNGSITINADGNATASVNTNYIGEQFDFRYFLVTESEEEQKKYLYKKIKIPSVKISSLQYQQENPDEPHISENLELTLPHYATLSNSRLFIPLNLMNKTSFIPKKLQKRRTDIVLRFGYTDCDSLSYQIPEGYTIEALPENQVIESKFGEYESTISVSDNKVLFVRKMKRLKGRFKPELYPELVDFYKKISRADNQKLILVKK